LTGIAKTDKSVIEAKLK
jgi:hypothetical protein